MSWFNKKQNKQHQINETGIKILQLRASELSSERLSSLDFQEYKTVTGHMTLYLTEPRSNILFKLSGGRYLAKDSGITIDMSRKFKTGFRVGAFFSLTDISDEEFGEGSFDKGFYFNIPIQSFFTNYRPGLTSFGLRPLTRDGAAKLNVGHDLYGVTDSASAYNIEFGWDEFYE